MTPVTTASLDELEARMSRLESAYETLEETLALPSPTADPAGTAAAGAPSEP